MARPRKSPADKRDRKLIVWVNAQEQGRFLVNAARAGLIASDYLRAVACGSGVSTAARDEVRLIIDAKHHGALLAQAGHRATTLNGLIVSILDTHLAAAPVSRRVSNDFEMVDALSRVGVALHQIASVTQRTDTIPDEIDGILQRLDRLLDRLLPP